MFQHWLLSINAHLYNIFSSHVQLASSRSQLWKAHPFKTEDREGVRPLAQALVEEAESKEILNSIVYYLSIPPTIALRKGYQ